MSERFCLTCAEEEDGSRVDYVLSRHGPLARNAFQRLIVENQVTVNGKIARKNDRLKPGDLVVAILPEAEPDKALPEDIPLDLCYEDADLLVLNKSAGIVVHPSPGHADGTLVNALLNHCGESLSGIGGVKRPGIVHRIDKDTSGLLVVAKNEFTHTALSAALKRHDVARVYQALVSGVPKADEFTINAPLGRHPVHRLKQAVLPTGGKEAVTHASVLDRFRSTAHLECRLETGRTHQIRVHLAYKGFPILGDRVYNPGRGAEAAPRQMLHAGELCFLHPRTGQALRFTAPLPGDFAAVLQKLARPNL